MQHRALRDHAQEVFGELATAVDDEAVTAVLNRRPQQRGVREFPRVIAVRLASGERGTCAALSGEGTERQRATTQDLTTRQPAFRAASGERGIPDCARHSGHVDGEMPSEPELDADNHAHQSVTGTPDSCSLSAMSWWARRWAAWTGSGTSST